MTTRRTPLSRSHRASAELRAWDAYFSFGRDFFRGLQRAGLTEEEMQKAAPDAWRRLGARFMQTWQGDIHRPMPWAWEQFGNPTQ